jgi:hypothetical protein
MLSFRDVPFGIRCLADVAEPIILEGCHPVPGSAIDDLAPFSELRADRVN